MIALAGGGTARAWVLAFLFAVVVPWLVFSWLIGFVIYFNHTHPEVPWFRDRSEWSPLAGMVVGSVRLRFPQWSLFFASNIMDHVAHHVDPRVPLVRLRRAQDRIDQLLPGQIVVQPWSIGVLFDVMRRCKIYDYDAHCWLDYGGRPTTACNLPVSYKQRGTGDRDVSRDLPLRAPAAARTLTAPPSAESRDRSE